MRYLIYGFIVALALVCYRQAHAGPREDALLEWDTTRAAIQASVTVNGWTCSNKRAYKDGATLVEWKLCPLRPGAVCQTLQEFRDGYGLPIIPGNSKSADPSCT